MGWIFKLVCLFGAAGAASLIGISEGWRLKLRVRQLEALIQFLQRIESDIRYTAAPIGDILFQHREELVLAAKCGRFLEAGHSFQESWAQAVQAENGGLTGTDREYLLAFGNAFGGLDQSGQLASCQLTRTRLEQQLEQARQDVTQKAKLYSSLGMLCGAAIFLVIV